MLQAAPKSPAHNLIKHCSKIPKTIRHDWSKKSSSEGGRRTGGGGGGERHSEVEAGEKVIDRYMYTSDFCVSLLKALFLDNNPNLNSSENVIYVL